ncbi:MAG: hypothetical protein GY795_19295 [Desulfobacterales bacterium]|nr:hypothetical protein [Desulfobacterales bacterium]
MRYFFLFTFSVIIFCNPLYSQTAISQEFAPNTVLMPWETFSDLRNQAKEPKSERSQHYAYERAQYTGTANIDKTKYYIRFQAVADVRTFGKNKVLVPFLSNKLNLESLTVDGDQSAWTEKDGFFNVLISEQGKHTIHSKFTVILDAKRWPRNLHLPLVKIPRSEIILNVPDTDIEARFEPGAAVDIVRSRDGDRIQGYVPAVPNVSVRWLKQNEEKEEVPLKMGAVIHTYISLEEKGANCQSEISFRILQGETNLFRILVPNSTDILDVSGSDNTSRISQWFTEEIKNARMIHIYASYQQNESFRVKLTYERTETKSTYQFTIPHLLPQSVERYENLIAVGSKANVEIGEARAKQVERRDVRFLPREIQQFAKGHALFYYKTLDRDFALQFNIKSHEKAPVVTTLIERTEADSVLTDAGTLMTKAVYHIKNNQAQFLRLRLPENSKLLSAFLKGQEVQPALDKDYLLIPIEKSAGNSFPIEIAFLTRADPFGILGMRSIHLPENKLPIGELVWRLYTPDDYQIMYFGGNTDRKRYGFLTRLGWILGETHGSTQNLAYAGYGWSSEKDGKQNYKYSEKGLKQRFRRKAMDISSGEAKWSGMPGNQIQVQIPITGKQYNFESYLIKDFTPEITIYYINKPLHNIIAFVAGILAFLFIFWSLALVYEKSSLPVSLGKIRNYLKCFAGVIVLVFLLAIFSLGITEHIIDGIVMAFVSFAVWQNRQTAKRQRAGKAETPGNLPLADVLLIVLLIPVIPMLIVWAWIPAALVCFISILLHVLTFEKKKILSFFTGTKTTETTVVFLIVSSMLVLLSTGVPATARAEQPSLPDTRVNLSWEVIDEMLKKIEQLKQAQQGKLESDYIFGTLMITGEVSKKFAELKFSVPLSILSDDYVKIPLFNESTAITEALFDGESLALNQEKGNVYFEAKRETDNMGILELNLIVPVREKGGVNEFSVNSPLIRGGLAELTFGKEIKSVNLYGVAWQEINGQKVKAALGRSGKLRGELATFLRKKESADESSKRVKKIYSTTYTLVSLEEKIATFYSSVRYQILNDLVREFTIRLPEDVIVHEIVGDDMEKWTKQKTENNITTYNVKVLYPVAEKYDLSVQYEKNIRNEDSEFEIPNLDVVGVARDVGYMGVEMQAQAEIFLKKISKARVIDIRELPEIIKADAYSPFVYAIRYVERPYKIFFEIHKHKNFEMDPAIADRIQYTYVISPKGKVLSQAKMWIRNSRKQFASFILPENASLVSTFLDGASIKPSLGQKGELLLPLKRQSANPFILDVVYEGEEFSLGITGGRIQLGYPRVDIPASIVASDIYIPQQMQFSEPGGDFEKIKSVRFVPWRDEAARIQATAGVTLSDLAPTGQDVSMHYQSNQPMLQEEVQAPVKLDKDKEKQQKPGGTLSLKINLPKRGRKISLNTFYVPAGVSLKADFFLFHRIIYYSGYALVLLLLAGTGFFLPLYRASVKILIPVIAGFIVLFYLVPLSWRQILFIIFAGVVIQYIWSWLKKKFKPV